MQITVFHKQDIPGNGDRTVFEGPKLSHHREDDGSLSIYHWENDTDTGMAAFAAGSWVMVITKQAKEV